MTWPRDLNGQLRDEARVLGIGGTWVPGDLKRDQLFAESDIKYRNSAAFSQKSIVDDLCV